MYTHTYRHTCTYIHAYPLQHLFAKSNMSSMLVKINTHTCTHAYIHTYIHTRTYTYVHACYNTPSLLPTHLWHQSDHLMKPRRFALCLFRLPARHVRIYMNTCSNGYTCMYACMYEATSFCTLPLSFTCETCAHIHEYMLKQIYVCVCIDMRVCMNVCMNVCMRFLIIPHGFVF
jgi:hypothetical protein